MFPFHTWLPDAHTDAPTAGSVILAAVLLKMGTYGFLRFSLPILPDASRHFVPMMVLLSIIGIVYGALVALAQKDWKRLVAYSSVSHMAMVMLGMFALNPVGHHRQHRPAAQSRHLDRRALPAGRRRLRAAAHARDLRVRRPVEGDAGLRRGLPDHDDVVDRAADAERLHRRVPDPAGRVRRQQDVGGVRGQRRRARRGLHALSLSADDVRQDREPEERAAARPEPARVRDVRAAADPRGVDGPLSGAVPAPARDLGAAHRRRASARSTRRRTCADCDPTPNRRRVARAWRQQPGGAVPGGGAVRRQRQSAADGAGASADAAGNLARATSITSCRSWCSRRARCSCSIADVLLPRSSAPRSPG